MLEWINRSIHRTLVLQESLILTRAFRLYLGERLRVGDEWCLRPLRAAAPAAAHGARRGDPPHSGAPLRYTS
eukprot:1185573-Prorocentrum_minimum.AAC.8